MDATLRTGINQINFCCIRFKFKLKGFIFVYISISGFKFKGRKFVFEQKINKKKIAKKVFRLTFLSPLSLVHESYIEHISK